MYVYHHVKFYMDVCLLVKKYTLACSTFLKKKRNYYGNNILKNIFLSGICNEMKMY